MAIGGRAWAFAKSPRNIRKFLISLPGLGPTAKNEIGQYLPLATKQTINRIVTHLHGGLTPWLSDGTSFLAMPSMITSVWRRMGRHDRRCGNGTCWPTNQELYQDDERTH